MLQMKWKRCRESDKDCKRRQYWSREGISNIFHLVRPGLSSKSVEKYLNREIAVSEVIGQDLVTKKRNLLNIY
jgi:hypothetical protein